jgi:hypothetical protein
MGSSQANMCGPRHVRAGEGSREDGALGVFEARDGKRGCDEAGPEKSLRLALIKGPFDGNGQDAFIDDLRQQL